MTDDQIGRWVAELLDSALRKSAKNELCRTALRIELERKCKDKAARFDGVAPWNLAAHFALIGEYAKAGRALRSSPGMLRVRGEQRQQLGRSEGLKTITC
jgi:hypothetical protein